MVEGETQAGVSDEPRLVYARRLARYEESVAGWRRVERWLSYVRLALFLAAAVLLVLGLFADGISGWWVLLPLTAFAVAVWRHENVVRARSRAGRCAEFYAQGLARLDDAWAGRGVAGDEFLDLDHAYAADLDLFGHGSLFELVCVARTRVGQVTLARWLCQGAEVAELRKRQAAVAELRPALDLREELAAVGDEVRGTGDPATLIEWSESETLLSDRWPPIVAGLLALTNIATGTAFLISGNILPLLISAAVGGLFALLLRPKVQRVLGAMARPESELELFARILSAVERQRFRSERLVELRADLDSAGDPPSKSIGRLASIAQTAESRRNMVFLPLASLLLLGTQLAFAIERWRSRNGAAVRRWLDVVGEIEALASLAGLAYENPGDPFPEIVDAAPVFDGRGLGHPLIPRERCVTNDVRLGEPCRLWLVSGSNMSGKSTLLRTVGVNCVLALAGATVRADQLRISPLMLGAAMRVQDSLQQGLSHFYAEIRRLRTLVELGRGETGLLFLLDELLHGTNSHDRRIGAAAVIRGLLADGGVGLVTTHDLALSAIVDELGSRAANVHFEDRLEEGRVVFDFRLRSGVVRHSNALDLMRAVGLEV